jgi:hypothetical protein
MTSLFAKAMVSSVQTQNGAESLSTPDFSGGTSGRMTLFFKSVRGLDLSNLYKYMLDSNQENELDTFILAMNIRDCRGGKGERDIGRAAFIWLFLNYPDKFMKVLPCISEYGRFDDILYLFPNVLNLSSLSNVCEKFNLSIDKNKFDKCVKYQKNIVHFYGDVLISDQKLMKEGKPCTLAAKWFVTEKDSLDKLYAVYQTLCTEMKWSNRKLRKEFITPLRSYLKIVEKYMCTGKWEEIDYNKVPSCAMKNLKDAFLSHDEIRFIEWKDNLSIGDPTVAKVNAKQLYPYELVREVRKKNSSCAVTEAQWKVLQDKVLSIGCLNDSVIVVDTSASMHDPNYIPFDVAVSLGIIISSVSSGPFKNTVLTFNSTPQLVVIEDGSLYDRWRQITEISWGGNTNLQATFELILDRGKKAGLTDSDMPKKLWIISDMQFDCCSGYGSGMTNFENIDAMYALSNYTRPQLVFWNVASNTGDFPVSVNDEGTALISGFSTDIMKTILDGGKFDPYSIMRRTIDDSRYDLIRNAFNILNIEK